VVFGLQRNERLRRSRQPRVTEKGEGKFTPSRVDKKKRSTTTSNAAIEQQKERWSQERGSRSHTKQKPEKRGIVRKTEKKIIARE